MNDKVGIFYFRSLYSQSACSISAGQLSDYLLNKGYETKLYLLRNNNNLDLIKDYNKVKENDIIIYKTNYKDFEYGIRFFENILKDSNKKFYLVGPFAVMNKDNILKNYKFVDGIINIQKKDEIDKYFTKDKESISKNTIVCGIDREIEYLEEGSYINLEASSGCPYNCAFCHIKLMNYSKYEKDVSLLVDEIDFIVNKMNKKYLIFNDSVFWKNNSDSERIKKFIELIKERNIKFSFMIYLSLTVKIPNALLQELKNIGLIRVFFGVENISKEFTIQNNKYVSEKDTLEFINKLTNLNISYHIGFILFSPNTLYEDLRENIDFLYSIKKLFRPGILIEKMRILPNSKDSNLLYYDQSKIDQAYNYHIKDEKCEKIYNLLNLFYSNIDIRKFEQFFSGINIAKTILQDEKREKEYNELFNVYFKTLNLVNDKMYELLIKILKTLKVTNIDVKELKDLYSISEINYIKFMSFLYQNDREIYLMIPHGQEELNI